MTLYLTASRSYLWNITNVRNIYDLRSRDWCNLKMIPRYFFYCYSRADIIDSQKDLDSLLLLIILTSSNFTYFIQDIHSFQAKFTSKKRIRFDGIEYISRLNASEMEDASGKKEKEIWMYNRETKKCGERSEIEKGRDGKGGEDRWFAYARNRVRAGWMLIFTRPGDD